MNLPKRFREALLDCRLVVELAQHALDDPINNRNAYIVLDGNVHLRTGGLEVPRQSGKTV
jgi:hypothetical protein